MVAQRQSVAGPLRPGMRVEVVNHFTGTWAHGFEVFGLSPSGCRVRRVSDQAVIPIDFDLLEVRVADGVEGERR